MPLLNCNKTAFPKGFNAWSVKNARGIIVKYTDNLVDYLKLVREGKAVLVFYISFLKG